MEPFTVIVPVYNQKKFIGATLNALRELLAGMETDHELIIVDDGSTDGTSDILHEEIEKDDFRYIRHSFKNGYGGAMKCGIRAAHHNVIVTIDPDMSFDANQIPALVQSLARGYQLAVGARTKKGTRLPLVTLPMRICMRLLAKMISGHFMPDLDSGLRAFRKEIVFRYFNIIPNNSSFTSTMTVSMLVNGYNVAFLPVSYKAPRGAWVFNPLREVVDFLQLSIRLIMYFKPLRVFLPVSLSIVALACGFQGYAYVVSGHIAWTALIGVLVLAIQILGIGMIADLIDKRSIKGVSTSMILDAMKHNNQIR